MRPPRATAFALLFAAAASARADGGLLQSFQTPGEVPAAPWHSVGLPRQNKPFTRFSLADQGGKRTLRVEADNSYGNLVHPLHLEVATAHLAWRWKVDELVAESNLHTRQGDDSALKVCVLFDLGLDNVPFSERQMLRLARLSAGEALPAATICYVWDAHLPPGSTLASPFTRRLRYKVLQSGPAHLHQWAAERRDVVADFIDMFGSESSVVPTIVGVAVGADADNTHGHSLAYIGDLVLTP